MIIPIKAHVTDMTEDAMVTDRKLLCTLIAEIAGNITKADISREPTRFIANTIITAIRTAIMRL